MDHMEIKNLPNEILIKIFEYLNYDDLRDASLVCHQWYDLLHRNQFLPSLSIVKAVKLNKDEDLEFLNNTNNLHNFQNWYFEDHEILLKENCQLHKRESIKFIYIDSIVSEFLEIENLIEILIKFKNLEELNLRFSGIFINMVEKVKNIYNLKSLSISTPSRVFVSFYKTLDLINFLDLFSIIKTLEINEYPLEQKQIDFIISKFGRTLKELHLAPEKYEPEHRIIKLSNLNLKKLKCNSLVLEFSNFEEFIKTQKELVSLDLLDAYFLKDEFITNIIGNMKNLKELKVVCENDSLFKIMKLKNLKKLHAKWVITRDMQELYQGGENNVLYELRVSCEIETEILSTFFKEKFPNLRSLILNDCSEVVTDSLLQLIFKNCTNLLRLDLSGCKKITNKGITGMNSNENNGEKGVSIANLKGLRSLYLSSCKITDFSLEFGLKFLELRELYFVDLFSMSNKKGLEHLAQNCPSLVTLVAYKRIEDNEVDLSKFKRLK